jgi:hypothetical protein
MAERPTNLSNSFKRLVQLAIVTCLTALAGAADIEPYCAKRQPKWHQSGIFIEDIEVHGLSPCRGTLWAVPRGIPRAPSGIAGGGVVLVTGVNSAMLVSSPGQRDQARRPPEDFMTSYRFHLLAAQF